MNRRIITIVVLLLSCAAIVIAKSGERHIFQQTECGYCHIDEKNDPLNLNSDVTGGCQMCHTEYAKTLSHPTSFYPTIPIPDDMPLTEGRLTCTTCHYVHPDDNALLMKGHNFLRRQTRGMIFCSACHEISEKRHIVFENVHAGQYEETDRSTRIDRMSLECITCHDRHIEEPRTSLGAGNWKHFKKEFNHAIGIPYDNLMRKNRSRVRPAAMLKKEITLYDGKIGCGTCHNVYSKERAMLIMDNRNSSLCFECHDK